MSPALAEGFIFNIPHKYSYETRRYLVPKDLPSNIAFQMLITVFLSPESLCPGASAFWPLFRLVSFKTAQLLRTPGTFFQGSSLSDSISHLLFSYYFDAILCFTTFWAITSRHYTVITQKYVSSQQPNTFFLIFITKETEAQILRWWNSDSNPNRLAPESVFLTKLCHLKTYP